MNCTPTPSALILLTLPILIQWLSYATYMGFMSNRRTDHPRGRPITWTISPTSPSTHWTLDLILGCRLAMALVSGDRLLLDGLGGLNRGVLQRRQIRHERVDLLIRHEFLVLVRHELLIVFLLKALGHPRPGSEQFFLHLFGLHQVTDVVQHRPALLDRALPADLVAVVTLLEVVLFLAERDQVPATCPRCCASGRPTAD